MLRVLSLFDGISCGMLALQRTSLIRVETYLASEVDPYAVIVSANNHERIRHIGEVESVRGKRVGGIDLLIGGPPCQSFSVCGDGKGLRDSRGLLVLEYVRILNEVKPSWFLMENVPMSKPNEEYITGLLGVKPKRINSSYFSASDRLRLYWTNIPRATNASISNKNMVLRDVMNDWYACDGEPVNSVVRVGTIKNGGQGDRIYSPLGKGIALSANSGGTAGRANMLVATGDEPGYRKLTTVECERLQRLPDDYTVTVPIAQRHKLIGNCWTVDVISYLLSGLT